MNSKILFLIWATCLITNKSFAHEGHGIPGALPPAPHGGVVQETAHVGKDAHSESKDEIELFFEAVYKNKEITVYPLTFPKDTTAIFQSVSPKKQLSNIVLKVEHARTKKTETLKASVTDDSIKASFDAKSSNRFIVHVIAKQADEEKTAKIQIETN